MHLEGPVFYPAKSFSSRTQPILTRNLDVTDFALIDIQTTHKSMPVSRRQLASFTCTGRAAGVDEVARRVSLPVKIITAPVEATTTSISSLAPAASVGICGGLSPAMEPACIPGFCSNSCDPEFLNGFDLLCCSGSSVALFRSVFVNCYFPGSRADEVLLIASPHFKHCMVYVDALRRCIVVSTVAAEEMENVQDRKGHRVQVQVQCPHDLVSTKFVESLTSGC
jgi:hypothetical protein